MTEREPLVPDPYLSALAGQPVYPAFEWLSTRDGSVQLIHPAGELALEAIKERQMDNATYETVFDGEWFDASQRTMSTLEDGIPYTMVRNRDNSDAGRSDAFFLSPAAARRYIERLTKAFEAGALGNQQHPQPESLDIAVYGVLRIDPASL